MELTDKCKDIRRMTRQRKVILEELQQLKTHPTADEVYQRVRGKIPNVSLGTVYRNLEVLTQCGLITRIECSGTYMRFDSNVEEHYHIRCINCDKVVDAPVKMFEKIDQQLEQASNYRIIGHRLEFIGICPQCKNSKV
jgi:Fe2+ or Zn2+ uptake regulation protein